MSNLLSIESAFLNLPQVKSAINLSEIKRARKSIENAQKSKFNHTMGMANLVKSAVEWFESEDGKAVFAEEGIQWSKADFGLKVFGWQKSYFYKVVKVATLDERILAAFNTACDNLGSEANRSLAGLLEFSRDIDLDSLEHAEDATEEQIAEAEELAIAEAASAVQEERVETMFTMSWKNPEGRNVAIRVDANGQIITQNDSSEVSAAINFLSNAINNTRA